MAVQKNFVVKNGLEVNDNLIYADLNQNTVGIGTTTTPEKLQVNGGIGATSIILSGVGTFPTADIETALIETASIDTGRITVGFVTSLSGSISTFTTSEVDNLNVGNADITGITTINNLHIDGYLNVGDSIGLDGQVLVSTGTGVTWSKLFKSSITSTAFEGQDTFFLSYEVGSVEVYINGVRLSPNEYVATNGTSVVLIDSCFGGETVEILANQVLPNSINEIVVSIGITVQDEGSVIGGASSIRTLNFVGSGVSVVNSSPGVVDIDLSSVTSPPGKTIYVAVNGSDSNDGLTLDFPKKTIKSAVGIASTGDTIKVSPGTYVEDNPINISENVSIEGAELRNCIVTPQNPNSDLFLVTNGDHLCDLSFHGQETTASAAVVAFKPLVGYASDRFFDAARIIRYNLDFIASEAVGYLTSTDYRNPAFTLIAGVSTVTDDIKNVYRALSHDITRGGNSKCVGIGLSQYNEYNVGIKTEIIDAIYYSAGIAKSCINNVLWGGSYQSDFTQLRDLSIQADPATGSNIDINSCTNVVSAIYSCVGVVTTIIDQGPSVVGTGFNLMYPGNAGIGTTNPNDIPSQGVGNVTKGPYIRNCTNFIPGSVGLRVDGFHADPGDQDDMGITGMMSVDSYTQYNQGGTGAEIKNGAYAQLVSLFSICNNEAIVTEGGGQCDITNSNSSFGTYGLVSDGIAGTTSKSSYRYTANVSVAASEGDTTVVLSGVGTQRPYSGQVLYFGELFYDIESVTINPNGGGSGYTEPPDVVFLGDPSGPSAISAEALSEIEDGKVVSINLIGNGRNYRLNETTATLDPNLGSVSVSPVFRPLYYKVRSATKPVAGISTVTLTQELNNDVGSGTTTYLFRQSLQIVSSHSFEYIGAGNTIETARPSKGGVNIRENEVVKLNGGEVVYTSTDQDGNFAIGEDLIINQATGTITGRSFERSLLNTVTPFIIALGAK
jgi:hypothetical protein